jgi:hypothetical protein
MQQNTQEYLNAANVSLAQFKPHGYPTLHLQEWTLAMRVQKFRNDDPCMWAFLDGTDQS